MEQIQQQTQANVETVDLSPQDTNDTIMSNVETQDNAFRNPIMFRDSTPALPNPKTFKEQFYFYKNGSTYKFYVNIDGTWKEVTLV